MQPHEEREVAERDELDGRSANCADFIGSSKIYKSLPERSNRGSGSTPLHAGLQSHPARASEKLPVVVSVLMRHQIQLKQTA